MLLEPLKFKRVGGRVFGALQLGWAIVALATYNDSWERMRTCEAGGLLKCDADLCRVPSAVITI